MLLKVDSSANWPVAILYIVLGALLAGASIHLLNLCEKIFDQLDIMPTYFACLQLSIMTVGLIVANEIRLYSASRLFLLFLTFGVSLLGMSLLVLKQSQITIF